jgi:hypothetical protein
MRNRLLLSIAGIILIAAALAGLSSQLDLLKNPVEFEHDSNIILENGLQLNPNTGEVIGAGLGCKGP